MKLTISVYFVLIITAVWAAAAAKKGCRFYGHSCYGGHGKRSTSLDFLPMDKISFKADRSEEFTPDNQFYATQRENPLRLIQKLRQWVETHPLYVPDTSSEYN